MRSRLFIRHVLGIFVVSLFIGQNFARSQILNLSDINIGQQSDSNVQAVQTFTNTSLSPQTSVGGVDLQLSLLSSQIAVNAVVNAINNLRYGKKLGKLSTQFFARYDFVDTNSFIGKGVLDTQQADVGFDYLLPIGLDISPYFSYGHATDRTSASDLSSNAYGGTLSISQKILPLICAKPNHPNATAPFVGNDENSPEGLAHLYPRYDLKAGTDLTFGDAEKYTYKAGAGSPLSQDGYLITPNITFDMYFSPQWAVAIIPTWSYNWSSTDTGLSGSTGLLGIQDRNSYTIFTGPNSSVLLYEFNTLERDTNIEPLPPTVFNGYQTWAKFGAGVNYKINDTFTLKAQYTYEAFNKLYEAQYVTASLNVQF